MLKLSNLKVQDLSKLEISEVVGGKPTDHAGYHISSFLYLGGIWSLGYYMGYYL